MKVNSETEVAQSYLTLSDPMDCSLPGSSIHGIFQARVLESGAIAFSAIPPRVFEFKARSASDIAQQGKEDIWGRCGGASWAAVHGVAKSRTRLSNFTFTFHFHALEKEMATHSSVLA